MAAIRRAVVDRDLQLPTPLQAGNKYRAAARPASIGRRGRGPVRTLRRPRLRGAVNHPGAVPQRLRRTPRRGASPGEHRALPQVGRKPRAGAASQAGGTRGSAQAPPPPSSARRCSLIEQVISSSTSPSGPTSAVTSALRCRSSARRSLAAARSGSRTASPRSLPDLCTHSAPGVQVGLSLATGRDRDWLLSHESSYLLQGHRPSGGVCSLELNVRLVETFECLLAQVVLQRLDCSLVLIDRRQRHRGVSLLPRETRGAFRVRQRV